MMHLRHVLPALVAPLLCWPAVSPAAQNPAPVLFRNATVITMTELGALPAHDVLVVDGRIATLAPTGSATPPADATVVDASGRFLMPGLAEMHAHLPGPDQRQYAQDVLLLYVAHGITTVRGMLGHPWHLELRQQVAAREVLGPRIFTAGPSLNGNSVPDVATARRLVREQQAAGYDFLKLHPGLRRDVFDAIVATAREVDIPFSGHVSDDVGVVHALEVRQSAIDHLDGYMQLLVDPACFEGPVSPGFFGVGLTDCADEGRIPAAVAATVAAGTWMAPTQVLLEQWAMPPADAELAARPALRYLPETTLAQWRQARARFLGTQALGAERAARFIDIRRKLLGAMHRAGVPILLASDAPQVFNIPGDSAHAELEIYGASGMTQLEALATATVNPARFYDAEDRFGSIRPGLEADLVLLRANPLEDLAAARQIEGVMLRGRWLDRAALDERLAALEAR